MAEAEFVINYLLRFLIGEGVLYSSGVEGTNQVSVSIGLDTHNSQGFGSAYRDRRQVQGFGQLRIGCLCVGGIDRQKPTPRLRRVRKSTPLYGGLKVSYSWTGICDTIDIEALQ